MGLALAFQRATAWRSAAALALTAALFHVFNHSLFKSLLFFGAGAVLTATGERDMEHLGGLIHRMPQTAFAFLVGCVAISALPPLNGFVSEWLTFQAILLSPQLPQWGLKLLVPAVGALLALSAALAAACFVKAFGVTFLGRPRSPAAASAAGNRPLLARGDVRPGGAVPARRDSAGLRDRRAGAGGAKPGRRPHAGADAAVLALDRPDRREPQLLRRAAGVRLHRRSPACSRPSRSIAWPRSALRRAPAWDCGYPDASPATQYTAESFAQPIRRVFGTVAVPRARDASTMPPPGDSGPARLRSSCSDPSGRHSMRRSPAASLTRRERLNRLQFLTIRPLSEPRLRRALVFLLLVLGDMALIGDLAVQGTADAAGAGCWRRCSPASCAR